MTLDEAIEILQTADFPENYTVEEIQQALDMALSALKKEQTDGDLISRKEAEQCCLNGWNKDYKEILEDIRKLPSAENTAEWVALDDYPSEDWECDNCGYMIARVVEPYRFCPNCGKKMWK